MVKVLFVCLGNICRSPMAEGVFRHLVAQGGLQDQFSCDSAGTSAYHIGELADPRMRQVASRHGIELTHRARQLQGSDYAAFDYLVAMDQSNLQYILNHSARQAEHADKIMLMRHYDEQRKDLNVPDPYYGDEAGFEAVYQLLLRTNTHFLAYLRQAHGV